MNIYIMVDMEGISGIVNTSQTFYNSENYNEGRQYTTWEVNACIEGCKNGGADKIIVVDHHGMGKNFIWEDLSSDAEYLIGDLGSQRVPFIDDCDGVILLGYHAMAGTPSAILDHTWSSRRWQNMWINNQLAGEILLDSAITGEYGKPVIMVSGDDKTCNEAKKLLPGVITAAVKTATNAFGCKMLSKEKAHELIRKKAEQAVGKCSELKPLMITSPVTMRLELVTQVQIPHDVKPYMRKIDGRTYEVDAESVEQALFRL